MSAGKARTKREGESGSTAKPSNKDADVAQLVEHSLGKGEVTGSIPVISSRDWEKCPRPTVENPVGPVVCKRE